MGEYDSFLTEEGEEILIVKQRYYYRPDDLESYKREMQELELAWQNETFHCSGCNQHIRRRDTYWFMTNFRFGDKYERVPERVKNGLHCVPCLEVSIINYQRICGNCDETFFIPIAQGKETYCENCRTLHSNEATRVSLQLKRARDNRLDATLTLSEWKESIRYFNRLCAYCQESAFMHMDHFIPLHLKGGTTARNCVPACEGCNARKRGYHPDDRLMIARFAMRAADIERVRAYLGTR